MKFLRELTLCFTLSASYAVLCQIRQNLYWCHGSVALYHFLCYHSDGGKVVPFHMVEVCVGNGGIALLICNMGTR